MPQGSFYSTAMAGALNRPRARAGRIFPMPLINLDDVEHDLHGLGFGEAVMNSDNDWSVDWFKTLRRELPPLNESRCSIFLEEVDQFIALGKARREAPTAKPRQRRRKAAAA
jgi:hypothetical protein